MGQSITNRRKAPSKAHKMSNQPGQDQGDNCDPARLTEGLKRERRNRSRRLPPEVVDDRHTTIAAEATGGHFRPGRRLAALELGDVHETDHPVH